jgi:hypothetical protein
MTPKPDPRAHTSAADSTQAVDEFMSTLEHPCQEEIQALRGAILGADPGIAEGIKWKVPSFRTTEYFATMNLREKKGIGLILHLGAKVREIAPEGLRIEDPQKLLRWLAPDRATIVFRDLGHLEAEKADFQAVIRDWILHV